MTNDGKLSAPMSPTKVTDAESRRPVREMADLVDTGVLWLINRTVFHPRGFALALVPNDDGTYGWTMLGDGTESWRMSEELDDRNFLAVEAFLAALRGDAAAG